MSSAVVGGRWPSARLAATASAASCDQSARTSPSSQARLSRWSLSARRGRRPAGTALGEDVQPALGPVRLVEKPQHPDGEVYRCAVRGAFSDRS